MKARNPHAETYDVVWHVHYLHELESADTRPHAMDVIVPNSASLQYIGERVAKLTNRPHGSICIASCLSFRQSLSKTI